MALANPLEVGTVFGHLETGDIPWILPREDDRNSGKKPHHLSLKMAKSGLVVVSAMVAFDVANKTEHAT